MSLSSGAVRRVKSSSSSSSYSSSFTSNDDVQYSSKSPHGKARSSLLGGAVRIKTPQKSINANRSSIDISSFEEASSNNNRKSSRNASSRSSSLLPTPLPSQHEQLDENDDNDNDNDNDENGDEFEFQKRMRTSSYGSRPSHNYNNRPSTSFPTPSSFVANNSALVEEETAKHRPWVLDDFVIGKAIGKGKFGNVYFARQKLTNAPLALKALFKSSMVTNDGVALLRREVEIQCRLIHPNITRLYGYFHDAKNLYLLLEYVSNGELYKHLSKTHRVVSETTFWHYVHDVASALHHMHQRNVIHRDLKPENILISEQGSLKIADFGWAIHAPPPQQQIRFTLCGTPEYIAPEIIREPKTGYSIPVDAWAFGVLMFELLFAITPFRGEVVTAQKRGTGEEEVLSNYDQVYANILSHQGTIDFRCYSDRRGRLNTAVSGDISREAQELIQGLLQPQQQQRHTVEDVLARSVQHLHLT